MPKYKVNRIKTKHKKPELDMKNGGDAGNILYKRPLTKRSIQFFWRSILNSIRKISGNVAKFRKNEK